MAEIRLAEGSIRFQDEWLTADDIKARIKEKMDAGDMKFAALAAALEELNQAMENAHPIEVRLVLSRDDYEKLQKRGGPDDNESVRKAILAFIEGGQNKPPAMEMQAPVKGAGQMNEKAQSPPPVESKVPQSFDTIPCSKCKKPVRIPSNERPLGLECEFCGTTIVLEAEKEETKKEALKEESPGKDQEAAKNIRHQDHFIG